MQVYRARGVVDYSRGGGLWFPQGKNGWWSGGERGTIHALECMHLLLLLLFLLVLLFFFLLFAAPLFLASQSEKDGK